MTAPTRRRRGADRLVSTIALVGLLGATGACATTVVEPEGGQTLPPGASPADPGTGTIEGGVIVDSVPATTIPIEGSAADLLPELAAEMSRLGSLIADDGDDQTAIVRIESIWASIRAEVETTHPELVNGIGSTVDMARVAVDRTRPADADKAFSILTGLVDKYTGDG